MVLLLWYDNSRQVVYAIDTSANAEFIISAAAAAAVDCISLFVFIFVFARNKTASEQPSERSIASTEADSS